MKCFYHVDQDGIVSGFYVRKACEQRGLAFEPEDFRKINYGMKFPFHDIEQDEFVFIVDYSIEPEEMWQLLSITKNVFWIDHHQSAIEKYEDFKCDIKGIRITGVGISGANLTWLYFKCMCNANWGQIGNADEKHVKSLLYKLEKEVPKLAKYTAMWDTFSWDEVSEEYVKAFHYAFESYDLNATNCLLDGLNGEESVVVIFKNKSDGTYSFVNLTKEHICSCKFKTIEEAIQDMNDRLRKGLIESYVVKGEANAK